MRRPSVSTRARRRTPRAARRVVRGVSNRGGVHVRDGDARRERVRGGGEARRAEAGADLGASIASSSSSSSSGAKTRFAAAGLDRAGSLARRSAYPASHRASTTPLCHAMFGMDFFSPPRFGSRTCLRLNRSGRGRRPIATAVTSGAPEPRPPRSGHAPPGGTLSAHAHTASAARAATASRSFETRRKSASCPRAAPRAATNSSSSDARLATVSSAETRRAGVPPASSSAPGGARSRDAISRASRTRASHSELGDASGSTPISPIAADIPTRRDPPGTRAGGTRAVCEWPRSATSLGSIRKYK